MLLRRLPSVRLQLTGLAMLAVALPLASVTFSGLWCSDMGAQAEVLFVSAAAAATSLVGAILLTRNIVLHLERVRDASHELASGDLAARAPEGGPAELAELATSFNAMAGHLEEVFDARRELVAWASHDLRGSDHIAAGNARGDGGRRRRATALSRNAAGAGPPPEHPGRRSVRDGLHRLRAITLAVEPVDVGRWSRDFSSTTSSRRRPAVSGSGQSCETRRPGPFAPRTKVERVLTNLVSNALRHTPAGGLVHRSVTSGAGAVFVSLEDSGPGVAEEERERIFEPFWRGDAARALLSGRGRTRPGYRPGVNRRSEGPYMG